MIVLESVISPRLIRSRASAIGMVTSSMNSSGSVAPSPMVKSFAAKRWITSLLQPGVLCVWPR